MAETKYEPRLKAEYVSRIRQALREQFSYANEMQIPKLDKIVINMGVGEATADSKKPTVAARIWPRLLVRSRSSPGLVTLSLVSRSAKTCRLAQRLPCAALACMSSWTV